MRLRLPSRKNVLPLISGVAIGALLLGTSYAITSKSFTYSKTKTGYQALSPMDFSIDGTDDGANGTWFNDWSGSSISSQNPGRCFNTGLKLPQGAKIKSVRFFYQSNATSDLFGGVVRQRPNVPSGTVVASTTPEDDTDTPTSAVANVPADRQKIDNSRFQYGVGVCATLGTTFHGARVKYTYKSAGD